MKLLVALYTNTTVTVVRPVAEMLLGLHEQGLAIEIITNPDTFYNKKFKEAGITVHEFFPKKKIDFTAIGKLRRLFKTGEYDIFQCFHNKWMATANLAGFGVPITLVGYRGIGFKASDPSYLLSFNNPRLNYLICLSDAVEQNIKPQLWFHSPKTVRIYKGQSTAWFSQAEAFNRQDFGIAEDDFLVINLSNVRPIKGVEYLIKTWEYLPDELPIHLMVVGQNANAEAMQQLAEKTGKAARIHLLGLQNDVVPYLKMADLYAVPTIGIEGLSRALLEAMSIGLPAVVTECGGPQELAENKVSGIHVPKKDPKAMAEAIISLYQNPTKLRTMGQAAKQRIDSEFSLQVYIENMLKLYEEIRAGNEFQV